MRERHYSGPDAILLRYLELAGKLYSIQGQSLVAMVGERCAHEGCRGRRAVLVTKLKSLPGQESRTREVCSDCRRPWSPARTVDGQGVVQLHPRHDATEARLLPALDELRDLVLVLSPVPRGMTAATWDFALGAWDLSLRASTPEGVVDAGLERYGYMGDELGSWWITNRVLREVERARTVVASRALRLGLISPAPDASPGSPGSLTSRENEVAGV